jgi:hypothetical protein
LGAAAYRSGEKLHSQSLGAAAYRAGDELRGEDEGITYDYTKKKGVVHSEIILPDNAPPEYRDRETLWNVVEAREKRKDARLAREIEVALQTEFELEEQKALLREYIQENLVKEGMIADFSIHDNKGNPHAHIMLTTRNVTPDGFGNKNRDWDREEKLLAWREKWAEINNLLLEQKGLDERIDHRTLKAQGIDREPTIHIGAAAWAMEKRGIRTERGDRNREIQQRNAEREALNAARDRLIRADLQQQREAEKTAAQLEKTEQRREVKQDERMQTIEEQLKAEKAAQIAEKLQAQRAAREEAEKIAKQMNALREQYVTLERELRALKYAQDEERLELPSLSFRTENIDEEAKNIETLQHRLAQLQAERKKLAFWAKQRKQDLDKKIERVEDKIRHARTCFKMCYHVEPEQAPEEIKRVEEKIKIYSLNHTEKIPEMTKRLEDIEKEYHKQKLLSQLRPDNEQIEKLLERWQKPPETVRERLHYERINRRLNLIMEDNVEEIIKKVEQQQAQKIRDMMERHREERARIREKELERERLRELNRNRSYVISR